MQRCFKPLILSLILVGVFSDAESAVIQTQQNFNQQNLQALQSKIEQLNAQMDAQNADFSQDTIKSQGFLHTNPEVTQALLSVQTDSVDNVGTLLNAKKLGQLAPGVTLGGFAEMSAIYEDLSHVTSNGQAYFDTHVSNMENSAGVTSGNASQLLIPRIEMAAIGNLNDWSIGYFSMDVRNLPGYSSSTTQQNFAVDSAILIVGNLNQFPLYAFMGRDVINFGRFETVNFNTPPLNRLAFQAYGDQIGLGFEEYGLSGSFSVLNDNNTFGGMRSDGVAYNTYTVQSDGLENYAVNLGYHAHTIAVDWNFGVGYLNGSKLGGYSDDLAASASGAYDLNASARLGDFGLLGEFSKTTGSVYNTTNNSENDHLSAWDLGGQYDFLLMGKKNKFNLDYSRVLAQYAASQWVMGISQNTFKNLWMGFEYSNSKGRFVAGQTCSLRSGLGACTPAVPTVGSVYGHAYNSVPTSAESASNSTFLFDIQGVF